MRTHDDPLGAVHIPRLWIIWCSSQVVKVGALRNSEFTNWNYEFYKDMSEFCKYGNYAVAWMYLYFNMLLFGSNFEYYFGWTQYANWDAAIESVWENESKRARGGPDSDTNLCLCFLAGPEKMQWISKWSMLLLAPPALWVSACICVWESERERHRLLSAEAFVPASDQRNFIWWADRDVRSMHQRPKTTTCYQPSYTLKHKHQHTHGSHMCHT